MPNYLTDYVKPKFLRQVKKLKLRNFDLKSELINGGLK